MVNQRQIEDNKVDMKVSAFLKMCRIKQIIPNSLNIEQLNDYIKQCITPMDNHEYAYIVEEERLLKIYNEDHNPETSHCEPAKNEPGLMFHEFIFLLALIALKSDTNTVEYAEKIENFFRGKLQFDPIPENAPEREGKDFDHYLAKAQMRAEGVRPDDPEDEDNIYSEDEGEDEMDRFEIDEKQKLFKQFLEQKAAEEANFDIDFDLVLEQLDERLPMIPGKPEVQQFMPRKDYKFDKKTGAVVRITFGKLYPREDDGKKKKKAAKAPARKKDEKPPKPIKWDGPAKPHQPDTMELMRMASKDMAENTFPMNIRGDQQNPGIMPHIIKEVFFPPEAPHEVATLIESALVYQNSANYQMAIRSLEEAR